MRDKITLALIIVVSLILFYQLWFKYSVMNTRPIGICAGTQCETYYVHREHDDPEAAAKLLEMITERNTKLIEYLRKKYETSQSGGVDPDKSGRIDIVPGDALFSDLSSDSIDLSLPRIESVGTQLSAVAVREYLHERIEQLVSHYSQNRLYEISPLNSSGVTSYSEDKKKLILCLRKKEPDANGVYELHDINTMMFVVLHELAHMCNNQWGHSKESNFWVLFKFLLTNAVECGVYQPINYGSKPIVYCGLSLTYNPFYDARL